MKHLKLIICIFSILAFVGCAAPYSGGFILSDYNGVTGATSNQQGAKVGEATMVNYLGWIAQGDASIKKAAENGGIQTISTVDYKYNSILGIINTTTTIVTGN